MGRNDRCFLNRCRPSARGLNLQAIFATLRCSTWRLIASCEAVIWSNSSWPIWLEMSQQHSLIK